MIYALVEFVLVAFTVILAVHARSKLIGLFALVPLIFAIIIVVEELTK